MVQKTSQHVFISYSRKDGDVMRRIVQHLRAQSITAWVDAEYLAPGTRVWEYEIERAIINSFAVVVVLSPDAKNSEWVLREITLADEYQKQIFPVIVAGRNTESIPFRLITHQFADIRQGESQGLQALSDAVYSYWNVFQRKEEERKAAEQEALRVEQERKAKQDAERLARQKEEEKKAKEEVERIAQEKAEEERVAKAKLEAERKAKAQAEAERLARLEAEKKAAEEADRLAQQKLEEKRIARAKLEAERKAEADRIARQKAEKQRQARLDAERKAEEERKLNQPGNQRPESKVVGIPGSETAPGSVIPNRSIMVWGAIVIIGLIVLAVSARGLSSLFNSRDPGANSGGTLKVVASLPRTGSMSALAQPVVNGMQMRLDEADGKVCGGQYMMALEVWDDASTSTGNWDPVAETDNANRAADDNSVIAYLGPMNTGAAKLSIPILNQAGPLAMISFTTNPQTTKPGLGTTDEPDIYYPSGVRNFTHIMTPDDVQAAVAARFMFNDLGVRTVYVLDDKSSYGNYIAETFRVAADQLGMTVVGSDVFDTEASDYRTLMSKISTSNQGGPPDALYVGMFIGENEAQLLQDKFDILGDNNEVKFMGPDGIYTPAFVDSVGALAEGLYASVGQGLTEQLPSKGQDFIQKYESQFGPLSDLFGAYGYESVNVTIAAVEKVCADGGDPFNRRAVRDALFSISDFDGVLGTWSFDSNGDTTLTDTTIYVIKNGTYELVGVYK